MQKEKQFLTVAETMLEIKTRTGYVVSRNTFYNWLSKGDIPKKRMKKRIFIAISDLNIFLADFIETSKQLVEKAA